MYCTYMALVSKLNTRHVLGLLALIAIGVACYLASVFETFPGDESALEELQGFRNTGLDVAAVISTTIGHALVIIVSILMLALALWSNRRRADALVVLMVLVPEGLNQGLKFLVDRPRPEFSNFSVLTHMSQSGSFPSGHSVHAFLFIGFLIYITGELVKPGKPRLALQGFLAFLILAVGTSRVYLGVHWPSDVLGGYLVGGSSLMVILWVRKVLISRGLQ